MATVKCKYCGTEIDKSIAYNPNPRQYYCSKEHFNERERERLGENGKGNKIKYKPKDDGNPRRIFTDKVLSIFVDRYGWNKNKINWSMICATASNVLKEHENWSYDTLTYILFYMNDILELDLICSESNYNPLSLLPFYAKEAEDYWLQCSDIEKSIENFDFDDNSVVIKKSNGNNKKKRKEINMNEI